MRGLKAWTLLTTGSPLRPLAEEGVCSGMERVHHSMLPFSFLHHAGLFLIHM
jgi:hypothetical protein